MDHHHLVKGYCSSSSSSSSGSRSVYNNMNSSSSNNIMNKKQSAVLGRNSSSVLVEDEEEEEMMMMMSGGGGVVLSTEDLRRGPWTVEEDFTLINYIAHHGEGRWNSLARCAGLKRTGKSCRLRWLNYLRPDVRRGNITLEEQLLILELHSRWGNRWSKIAQHLPGRTDNEIKNYWRTRVQKHAKQLKCDVNSKQFKDTMRYLWMPRLVERIQAASAASSTATATTTATTNSANYVQINNYHHNKMSVDNNINSMPTEDDDVVMMMTTTTMPPQQPPKPNAAYASFTPENSSSGAVSSDSFGTQFSPVSDLTDCYNYQASVLNHHHSKNSTPPPPPPQDYYPTNHHFSHGGDTALTSPTGYLFNQGLDMQFMEQNNNNSNAWMTMMMDGGDVPDENLWNVEDAWFLQQQLLSNNYI